MNKHTLMLDAFVENIKKNYADDIGMVIVYGSYVTQTMHELSDIDVMFVGKTDRAYEMQKQFIYEGIGYDFFCMPISRVHEIIDEFSPLISIIAEGELIYADSDEKVEHFTTLKNKINHLSEIEPVSKYFPNVEEVIKQLKTIAFDHQFAALENKRHLQGKIIYAVMHYLQLINRKHFKYGIKRIFEEIQSMELKPKTILYYLELLQKDTVGSKEIMTFVSMLDQYFQALQKEFQEPFDPEAFKGFYEEEVSVWNKLIMAAKNNDLSTAFLAATSIENELSHYRMSFPMITHLFSDYRSNVESLVGSAKQAEIDILQLLKDHKIQVTVFHTLEAVIDYLLA